MGQRVGLHDQPSAVLVKPTAAIACPDVHKIHGAVMLGGPVAILNLVFGSIDQHDAARAQDRHHSPVTGADISVDVMAMAVGQHAFKMAPLLHHSRKQFCLSRIEGRVKLHGNAQGSGRGHGMGQGHFERRPVMEALFQRNVVPAKDFQWTQVVESG